MPQLITISDPDDPRIAGYRQVREPDLVGREGLFIAEGEIVVRVLARAPRFAVQSMLLARAHNQVSNAPSLLIVCWSSFSLDASGRTWSRVRGASGSSAASFRLTHTASAISA